MVFKLVNNHHVAVAKFEPTTNEYNDIWKSEVNKHQSSSAGSEIYLTTLDTKKLKKLPHFELKPNEQSDRAGNQSTASKISAEVFVRFHGRVKTPIKKEYQLVKMLHSADYHWNTTKCQRAKG